MENIDWIIFFFILYFVVSDVFCLYLEGVGIFCLLNCLLEFGCYFKKSKKKNSCIERIRWIYER